MSADLTKPFAPACCEGTTCEPTGAKSCGCDPAISHTCARHQKEPDDTSCVWCEEGAPHMTHTHGRVE